VTKDCWCICNDFILTAVCHRSSKVEFRSCDDTFTLKMFRCRQKLINYMLLTMLTRRMSEEFLAQPVNITKKNYKLREWGLKMWKSSWWSLVSGAQVETVVQGDGEDSWVICTRWWWWWGHVFANTSGGGAWAKNPETTDIPCSSLTLQRYCK